jgi:hypothetical protein
MTCVRLPLDSTSSSDRAWPESSSATVVPIAPTHCCSMKALAQKFGSERVFREFEDIQPGQDFVAALDLEHL